MARARTKSSRRRLLDDLRSRLAEHGLPIYASAIAFRAIVALIPLVLLGLGLLGALGLQSTWQDSIAPAIQPRVTQPVYDAIDYSAKKILSSGTAGLIVFASALVLWDLAIGVNAIMNALNRIHDVEERRSPTRRALTAVWLAGVSGALDWVPVAPTDNLAALLVGLALIALARLAGPD